MATRIPIRLTLEHQEQFTLFLRARELYEMMNDDLHRPASERAALTRDFFRCARKLSEHRLNLWKLS